MIPRISVGTDKYVGWFINLASCEVNMYNDEKKTHSKENKT